MHPNVGLVSDLANALGVSPVDARILLNTAGVRWKAVEGCEAFNRADLVQAFRSGLVKAQTPPEGAAATYSMEEAAERYRASLPTEGMPF